MASTRKKSQYSRLHVFQKRNASKVLNNASFVLTPASPNSAHLPLSFVVEKGRRRGPKHLLDEAVFFSFVLTLPEGLLTKTP